MTSETQFRPLFAIADSYLVDSLNKISPEIMDHLKSTLHKYIDNEITLDEATAVFQLYSVSKRALDRISAILNVSSSPISPTETNSQINMMNGTRKKTHPWNEYEDQRLLCAINKYGLDNWSPVSAFVGNGRTRAQCSQRWFRGLDPRISKVLWSPEEEQNLLQLIDKYGDRAWTKISAELGNRSDAQCRYHYRQMMKEKNMSMNLAQERHQISATMSAPSSILRTEIQSMMPLFQTGYISQSPSRPALPPISSILDSIDSGFPVFPNRGPFQFLN
ncbi:Myb-like DNA-binding domain containing protein [Histomonas meleagridis]|uniref:Myb-like DNA-binding domain containing protein n=1 Tax=Histomonas meleagridis TaxID=135588 RepID=UPI00355ABFD1|nr:Myb-like DNA-binding domain containing protein [Histomonas meleagridis]KAH0803034.1 Myb-like DNA-binding domain containing protein [Histomonas meleagridis]